MPMDCAISTMRLYIYNNLLVWQGTMATAGDEALQQAKQLVLRPDVRHHLSKLLYAEEWAKSIEESHPVSEARNVTLAKHWEDVGKIQKVLYKVQSELMPMMQSRQRYDEVMGRTHTAWF